MPRSLAKDTTTRTLRAHLRELLADAAAGKEIVVTLRGKPYVRIVPIASSNDASTRYPLRGSIRAIADDFDDPAPDAWEPPKKKPARPAPRRRK